MKTQGSSNSIEQAYSSQQGRISSMMRSASEGFKGSFPLASIVVVAQCRSNDQDCSGKSVSIVRDAFAEGVAYGVDDALKDALDQADEIHTAGNHDDCIVIAAAVLDEVVSVRSSGECDILLISAGKGLESHRTVLVPPGETLSVRLIGAQSVILATGSLNQIIPHAPAAIQSCRKPLQHCLDRLIEESRLRYRKQGGSIAVIRSSSGPRAIPGILKYILAGIVAGSALFFLQSILCSQNSEKGVELFTDSVRAEEASEETVMPLNR